MDEQYLPLFTLAVSFVLGILGALPGLRAIRKANAEATKISAEASQVEQAITDRVIARFRQHIDDLEAEITELKDEQSQTDIRYERLEKDYEHLNSKYDALAKEYSKVVRENMNLRGRIAELERELGKIKNGNNQKGEKS